MQFGEGQTFYVQYRARFDPGMLRQFDTNDGTPHGFKTSITGEGDQVGESGNMEVSSCTEMEIVFQADARVTANNIPGQRYQFVNNYHSCGNFDSYEWFDGTQIRMQTHPSAPPCYYPNDPQGGCVYYAPNEWMTFTQRVDIGTWNTPSSRIRWYVAREGQPRVLVNDTADKAAGALSSTTRRAQLGHERQREVRQNPAVHDAEVVVAEPPDHLHVGGW